MVLIQSFIDWMPVYSTDDDIAFNDGVGASAMLEAEHMQLAVSTAALHNYRLTSGLICFDDGLRYWVKPVRLYGLAISSWPCMTITGGSEISG